MDLPTLNALMRVNGLTKESAPENITDVLLRSGYHEGEVPQAIAVLKGEPPPPSMGIPAAYVAPIISHTSTLTRIAGGSSIFAGRINVRQFWLGTALAVLIYGLMFIFIEVSAVPIFSIISGISLFAPPDLATAPVRVLLLFGIGVSMLLLPAIFFLVISVGLQVRRCHDFGISGSAWFMLVLALSVSGYLLGKLTPLAILAAVLAALIWLVLLSWPGAKGENLHGDPATYPSIWGALCGCLDESDNMNRFAKRFLLPLVYLQVSGIVLGFCINTILPRVHMPSAPATHAAPAAADTLKLE